VPCSEEETIALASAACLTERHRDVLLSASDTSTATECASYDPGPSNDVYAMHEQMECLQCMSTAWSHVQTGICLGAWQAMATALQTIGKFVVKKKVGEQEQIFGR